MSLCISIGTKLEYLQKQLARWILDFVVVVEVGFGGGIGVGFAWKRAEKDWVHPCSQGLLPYD